YVRLHDLLDPDRREDAPAVREVRPVQVVDVQELALVEDAEIAEQSLDHLAFGENADRGIERVVVALECVREAACPVPLLEYERLVPVLREECSGRDATETASDDDDVVCVLARLGHRSTLTRRRTQRLRPLPLPPP